MDLLNTLILILVAIIGAISTYYFVKRFKLSSVFVSCGLSLLIALFFKIFPNFAGEIMSIKIPVVFIGATFVGMSTDKIIKNYWYVLFSGLVFGLVFLSVSSVFKGFGGGLGISAAIGVICSVAVQKVFKNTFCFFNNS